MGMGPRFADDRWLAEYPYRTWEINWPEKCHIPWPDELVGWMEHDPRPDIDEYFMSLPYEGCEIN